ncbi:hypothetical protein D8I24_8146 [Cupriavidus necator H850]|nr:hypothetical protein D8I24_8146 [Cupriavidus necator H850]
MTPFSQCFCGFSGVAAMAAGMSSRRRIYSVRILSRTPVTCQFP